MKHALASVALLGFVVLGCDTSGPGAEDPGLDTAVGDDTTGGTGGSDGNSADGGPGNGTTGNGITGNATAAATTGSGFSSGTFGDGGFGVTSGAVTGGPGSVGGVGGAGGDSGVGCDDGVGGEGGARSYPEDPYPAIAMTRAQRQVLLDEHAGTSGVSTTGAVPQDPNDLFVTISDTAWGCDEYPSPECGGHWTVDLVLTESLRQVGVHDLAGASLGMVYRSEAEPGMPDVCGFVG